MHINTNRRFLFMAIALSLVAFFAFLQLCFAFRKNSAIPVRLDATTLTTLNETYGRMLKQVGNDRVGPVIRAYQVIVIDSYEQAGLYNTDAQSVDENGRFNIYAPRLDGKTADDLVNEMNDILDK